MIDSIQHNFNKLYHSGEDILTRALAKWLMGLLLIVVLTGCNTLEPAGGIADSGLGDIRELPQITPFGMP